MRAEILDLERTLADPNLIVTFSTAIGVGRARWRSSTAPELGSHRSIELDVDGAVGDFNAERNDAMVYSLTLVEGGTRLCGLLESVDADGMGYFRLGEDCVLMIETSSTCHAPGTWLRLIVPSTDLVVTGQGP